MIQITRQMTERQLQDAVIDMAKIFNWLVMHQRPARTERGWRTAIQGDPGFPDLVMVRGARLIFAELKSAKGRVDFHQATWLNRLNLVPGVEQFCWRPEDWTSGTIEEILR